MLGHYDALCWCHKKENFDIGIHCVKFSEQNKAFGTERTCSMRSNIAKPCKSCFETSKMISLKSPVLHCLFYVEMFLCILRFTQSVFKAFFKVRLHSFHLVLLTTKLNIAYWSLKCHEPASNKFLTIEVMSIC